MRILDEHQTGEALHALALDAPAGVGFAFTDQARGTFYGWHAHAYHQLIYAISGTTQLETEEARYMLPPGRAAWIPAGVRHRTGLGEVDGVSLYFEPAAVPAGVDRVRILAAGPLMREMILHARRWPLGAAEQDPLARSYFTTLALLCAEWLRDELALRLPRAADPAIARAMDYAAADPGAATTVGAIAAAGLSERSFRRRVPIAVGMTWQAWLSQARIMEAMGQLAAGARVTEVAADAGFASLSAFALAFGRLTGETPSAYRARSRRN